jgi:uncharacterized protein YkwD
MTLLAALCALVGCGGPSLSEPADGSDASQTEDASSGARDTGMSADRPDAGEEPDAERPGDMGDTSGGDAGGVEPAPRTVCEEVCALVYDDCDLFQVYYDGNEAKKAPRSTCVPLCEDGYMAGAEQCILDASSCDKGVLNACLSPDLEDPDLATLDPATNWPRGWARLERQIFALINLHRRIGGLDCGSLGTFDSTGALQWDDRLTRAARAHVLDMAREGFYGHVGSDGSSPSARMSREGYASRASGEIINRTFGGAAFDAMVSWIDSDSHCRRMMLPTYTDAGAGFARHPDRRIREVATVDFGASR